MSDEIIWQVLNQQFCAYKLKTDKEQNFCRNEYNVSGLCSRQSCPMANSKYATVKQSEGRLYLYMRTPERKNTPLKMWERIRLDKSYTKALQQLDQRLMYWPGFLIHKCKQRLTRLTQVAITTRRLAKKEEERRLVGVAPKVKRREATRERKALAAAKVEKAIEKELLERLKTGAYGDNPLNVDEKIWQRVMNKKQKNDELLEEVENENELEDELEDEDENDNENDPDVEYVSDDGEDLEDIDNWLGSDEERSDLSDYSSSESESESEDEDNSDNETKSKTNDRKRSKKNISAPKKKKTKHIEVEYEMENPSSSKVTVSDW